MPLALCRKQHGLSDGKLILFYCIHPSVYNDPLWQWYDKKQFVDYVKDKYIWVVLYVI